VVDRVKVYVDSSFDERKGLAGIGIVIQKGLKQRNISTYLHCPSNNYGELFAVYLGAILTHGQGIIYTDSETAIKFINNEVNPDKPRDKQQYYNYQMMKVLAYKVNLLKPEVRKVKAHTGQMKFLEIGNAMADLLSKQGRAKFYQSEKLKRAKFEHISKVK